MMKKYIAAAAVSMMVLGALTGCGSSNQADIGRDAALEAALNDVGVSESDTTRLRVSEDGEDGRKVYDVQFNVAEKEYDYEVQASDGRILSSDVETDLNYVDPGASQTTDSTQSTGTEQTADTAQNTGDSQNTSSGQNQNREGAQNNADTNRQNNANVAVSQEEAIQIALDRVPGSTEQDIRIELDHDDGVCKYEGEIIYNQKEYDFEIDANTGTILEWSEERD